MTYTHINRNTDDLHLGDKLVRLRLRDWMRAQQREQGINDRLLAARVGHNSSWSHGILSTTSWRMATVQKMVRALRFGLTFNVDTAGVKLPPPEGALLSDIYANNPDPDKREEAGRIDLCGLGRRYREALGLSPAQLGHRLGQEGKSVIAFETGDKPYYLLVTAQRYFRALGGMLVPVLTTIDGEPMALPEGEWVSELLDTVAVTETRDRVLVWNTAKPEAVVSFSAMAWTRWMAANVS